MNKIRENDKGGGFYTHYSRLARMLYTCERITNVCPRNHAQQGTRANMWHPPTTGEKTMKSYVKKNVVFLKFKKYPCVQ